MANIDIIATKVDQIQKDVSDIKHTLEIHYITKDEFEPVKKLAYGIAGIILIAVATAIIKLVLK